MAGKDQGIGVGVAVGLAEDGSVTGAVAMIEDAIANTGAARRQRKCRPMRATTRPRRRPIRTLSGEPAVSPSRCARQRRICTLSGADPFVAPTCPPPTPTAARTQRTHPQGSLPRGPDAAQVAGQAWSPAMRVTHDPGGAGVRPEQPVRGCWQFLLTDRFGEGAG